MGLVKISGPVSNFREETKVTSAKTSGHGYSARTSYRTEKQINFRVGRRPVSMKNSNGIELADGDDATVVGSESGGGIKAILVRNDEIEITYGMSAWYMFGWGVFTTFVGLMTLGFFIGLFIAPFGIYLLYKGFQIKKAHRIMRA